MNSGNKRFWEERYRSGDTPWQAEKTPQRFVEFARRHDLVQILFPGCGAGPEMAELAAAGCQITALDISSEAIRQGRAKYPTPAITWHCLDFFDFASKPFDWIAERAFLPALPPETRVRYAEKMARLVRPGGWLAGYFLYDGLDSGPPFGLADTELDALLGAEFTRFELGQLAHDADSGFYRRARWEAWQRH